MIGEWKIYCDMRRENSSYVLTAFEIFLRLLAPPFFFLNIHRVRNFDERLYDWRVGIPVSLKRLSEGRGGKWREGDISCFCSGIDERATSKRDRRRE